MKITHFKINFQAIHLKGIAYTLGTFCMLLLVTGVGYTQNVNADTIIFQDQQLFGDNYAKIFLDSNHPNSTQLVLRDMDKKEYGRLYGSGDGENFGLRDGDNDWSYVANKDSWTIFKIDNVEIMRLLPDGRVGIGTMGSTPTGYMLAVDGKVIAEEMRVKPSNFWDEVFETDYDLMSIEEKQKFTKTNKHLPSFAPESEIVNEGMEVGKSFADVAKELEEAHLYIYQLNDRIKKLEKQRSNKNDLQKQLDELKAQLTKLGEQSDE